MFHYKSNKMKKSFVFIPAMLLVLFLLNSFVLKEKEGVEKPNEEGQSCTGIKLGDKWLIDPFTKDPIAEVEINETGILSVQEAPNNGKTPGKKVNFHISIQDTNTPFALSNIQVSEYMNKSVQEADLKTILKHCKAGDIILLILSESGKYAPNIQRIKVERKKGDGKC